MAAQRQPRAELQTSFFPTMTTFCDHTVNILQQQQVFAAVSVIILCTQFKIMEMAHEDQTDSNIAPKKAQWNDTETNAFIDYLIANRLKMGATLFKLETFNKAASTLGTMDIRTHGPIKTGVHCRTKYNLVCCFAPPLFPPLLY